MESTETITGSNGADLFCYIWTPKEQTRSLLYVSHGYAEHTGRYRDFSLKMTELGFVVFGHDHIGHGKSGGERVEVDHIVMIKDVTTHVKMMKAKHPELPVYIFGHSFGGAVSVNVVAENQSLFSGMVVSSSLLKIPPQIMSPTTVKFLNSFTPNFMNSIRLKKLNENDITHDKKAASQYHDDPLVDHGGIRLRTVKESVAIAEAVKACMHKVEIPILIVHGKKDSLTACEGSELLYSSVSSKDKTIKIYEESYHEMMHEIPEIKDQYMSDVTQWFTDKLA